MRATKLHEGSNITVGSRVLHARQEKGFTQKELAEPDLTASYISHIESGKSRPSLKTLALLAGRLGHPVSYFLAGEEAANFASSQTADRSAVLTIARSEGLYAQGKYAQCVELLMPLRDAAIDPLEHVNAMYILGVAQIRSGQAEAGLQTLEEGRTQVRTVGDADLEARFNVALGDALAQRGQPTMALERYLNAYSAVNANTVRDPLVRLAAYSGYARAQKQAGDLDAVLKLYQDQAELTQKTANPLLLAAMYSDIASEGGQNTARNAGLAQALIAFAEGARTSAALHLAAGDALLERNDADAAESAFNQALDTSRIVHDWSGVTEALCRKAELALARHDTDHARQFALDADAAAKQQGDAVAQGRARLALAESEAAAGQQSEAETHFKESVDLAQPTGNRPLLNKVYVAFSQALKDWGRLEEAYQWLVKAYSAR